MKDLPKEIRRVFDNAENIAKHRGVHVHKDCLEAAKKLLLELSQKHELITPIIQINEKDVELLWASFESFMRLYFIYDAEKNCLAYRISTHFLNLDSYDFTHIENLIHNYRYKFLWKEKEL